MPLHLTADRKTWRCELDGHSFDVAKEGYVNLLVTHQRKARPPGDSIAMLRARRRFLDGGWYEPLRDAIAAALPSGDVLDIGCGEGYYTRDLATARVWGVDIAKEAVRLAAHRRAAYEADTASYAVGNAYDLPVLDGSMDALVSVFSPLHTDEFDRVLRPGGGRAVVVTPGPDHLAGLAEVLFADAVRHDDAPPFERPGATTERVRFDLALTGEAIADLIAMTPYSWFVPEARRMDVSSRPFLSTPAEFLVTTYQLR